MNITKNMKMKEVKEVIDFHELPQDRYNFLVLSMLLQNCEHIEVSGFGCFANLKLVGQKN